MGEVALPLAPTRYLDMCTVESNGFSFLFLISNVQYIIEVETNPGTWPGLHMPHHVVLVRQIIAEVVEIGNPHHLDWHHGVAVEQAKCVVQLS